MPPGLLEAYMPVADAISASLPETKANIIRLADSRPAILSELQFRATTAQEMDSADYSCNIPAHGGFLQILTRSHMVS